MSRLESSSLLFVLILFFPACYGSDLQGNIDADLASKKLNDKFLIFDATVYKNKPDLKKNNIKPLQTVARFWEKGEDKEKLPTETRVKSYSKETLENKDIAFVNVEHWPLRGFSHDVTANKIKYMTIMKWVKEASPSVNIGLYAMVPIRDYWKAITGVGSSKYEEWQRENDQLVDLANSPNLNILFPSLYTFYRDREGWVKYAIENIREARRLNPKKPVYVFLWPQYHNSNKLLGLDFLPADYWLLELETAFKYADGVVIWGGWDFVNWRQAKWDENAQWWNATKEFIRKIDSDKM